MYVPKLYLLFIDLLLCWYMINYITIIMLQYVNTVGYYTFLQLIKSELNFKI
jgi:hypothetical protein